MSSILKLTAVPPELARWVPILGDRWALWLVCALNERGSRFNDLATEPGLSRRVLSERLRNLEHEGLVERQLYSRRPARSTYHLTSRGLAVRDRCIEMLARASGSATSPPPRVGEHPDNSSAGPAWLVGEHPADRMLAADLAYAQTVFGAAIAPLRRYDLQYSSELVRTLREYLDAEASISVAAARLHAHRHTVRYRLGRIQELTGLDVDALADRERLILGLRASAILDAAGQLER